MPKISEERQAEQRERILRAAMKCFARRGIHSTTMDSICREAKLSRGAVYLYFKSKAALVHGMLERAEQNTRALLSTTASTADPADALFSTATAAMEALARPENEMMLQLDQELRSEATRDPAIRERLAANFAFSIPFVTGIATAMQAKGSIPRDLDPGAVARIFIALQDGLKSQIVATPHLDVRGLLHTARALLLR